MNRNIKLIWDFHGADAEKTAEHHAIHLREFDAREKTGALAIGSEQIGEQHYIAYMTVKEAIVFAVRDALLPRRAEVVE
ncbi:MAG: hypothetical protein KDD41_01345 [Flavobacteriales bacterium]|nr:hypothetical protein [Flavobacteriales bacterium]